MRQEKGNQTTKKTKMWGKWSLLGNAGQLKETGRSKE